MSKREELIALSLKYDGDYFKMIEAIKRQEKIEGVHADNAITIFDSEYPQALLELRYPPLVLWVKGNVNLLKKKAKIAIIGSRKPSDYALEATENLINQLSDHVFVSGLALGIDAKCHECSDKSIGVLGCGIDYIYPAQNKDLYKKLENNGLIISEYPGKVKPLGFHFPFRNRIVAALAADVNVMELQERSGTMTTINEALELGRNVRVLPFPYGSQTYNNKLINEGASIIL